MACCEGKVVLPFNRLDSLARRRRRRSSHCIALSKKPRNLGAKTLRSSVDQDRFERDSCTACHESINNDLIKGKDMIKWKSWSPTSATELIVQTEHENLHMSVH